MPIYVKNVRFGHATNSSSTHSIVVFEGKAPRDSYDDDDYYGWENFTLSSKEAKSRYLAATLLSNMDLGDVGKFIAAGLTGIFIADLPGGGIDHQSVLRLPKRFSSLMCNSDADFDLDFIEDFKSFLAREDVVILGGNDNSDGHPLRTEENEFKIGLPMEYSGRVHARKDGDEWVIFDVRSGSKVRMSFVSSKEYLKSKAPELVDVKITDFCPFGCTYCYMGSTGAGKHADPNFIYEVAANLAEQKVFEVAIGGGEPTLHPQFKHILEIFADNGTVPNFTTRNRMWFYVPENLAAFRACGGAFAFSVDNQGDVREWGKLLDRLEIDHSKAHAQYVIGENSSYALEGILSAASAIGVPVTLLGYKTTGRGATNPKPKNQAVWHEVVASMRGRNSHVPRIGIDTVLAQQGVPESIPKWCYTTKEGAFSCYVDAVEKKIGPSSFCPPEEMRPWSHQTWLKDFYSF